MAKGGVVVMTELSGWYSVIRYVPSIAREEFVNIGVILACPELGFADLQAISRLGDGSKVKFLGDGDGMFVSHSITNLSRWVQTNRHPLPLPSQPSLSIPMLDSSVLGLLHRTYNNNIQLTEPRPTAVHDPKATLENLFADFVGATERPKVERGLTRRRILERVEDAFKTEGLFDLGLRKDYVLPLRGQPKLDLAYQNQVLHCYRAIPLEGSERTVTDAVNAYRSVARDAEKGIEGSVFTALTQVPEHQSGRIQDLVAMLEDDGVQLADYREAPAIAQDIARDLRAHNLVAHA
jgi:hypothetical protein